MLEPHLLQQNDLMSQLLAFQPELSYEYAWLDLLCIVISLYLRIAECSDGVILNSCLILCFRELWVTWPAASRPWCTGI